MVGTIVQLSVGAGGIPKRGAAAITLTRERVVGDDWNWSMYKMQGNGKPGGHGGPERAVCLFSLESLEELKKAGYPVFPGALGENITTRGLDYAAVRIGDQYVIGSNETGAIIAITRPRQPCKTIGNAYSAPGDPAGLVARLWDRAMNVHDPRSPMWGKSGFYASVVREGTVFSSDTLQKLQL